jgi:molybdopterin/thiamine biosynthesis adenylyltransferase
VADRDKHALRQIDDAFVQRQFRRDWTRAESIVYLGRLDPSDINIPVAIELDGLDFIRPPAITIQDLGSIGGRNVPHVIRRDRSICYMDGSQIILDRYDPGGTVIQCLDQAEKVLRDAIRGRLHDDFAAEFSAYWDGTPIIVDLPTGYTGTCEFGAISLLCSEQEFSLAHAGSSKLLSKTKVPSAQKTRRRLEQCRIVKTDKMLTVPVDVEWPPKTLSQYNAWIASIDSSIQGEVEKSFARTSGYESRLGICAPNGLFFVEASLPPAYRKQEFLEGRRDRLPDIVKRVGQAVEITRLTAMKADAAYIFERNMAGIKNVSGKKILLIGCGTIGGFLAQQLVLAGAGAQGGTITLLDSDKLSTANLGRHLLGFPYLLSNKAQACRDFLLQQSPHSNIDARDLDAMDFQGQFTRFDLIIDATGEEAFSLALNEIAVREMSGFPPVIFVWLIGNGAAAQCLLTGDPEYACLKCLKTELSKEPRFRVLRKEHELRVERNLACGDSTYLPFPVSRSAAAAALACDVVIDWANGPTGARLRTMIFDHVRANHVKDSSPRRISGCPACGREG